MINFKKGPALSLHQTNYVAGVGPESITAGMVVRIGTDGLAYRGFSNGAATPAAIASGAGNLGSNGIYGVAINSSVSGDVIEAGKIGVYALDGATVIETDQFDATNRIAYTVGKFVTTDVAGRFIVIADALATGQVTDSATAAADTPKIIGQVVEAAHYLQNKGSVSTSIPGVANVQTIVDVITVKLAI